MKNMTMTAKLFSAAGNKQQTSMSLLVKERDYRAIGERLGEMEPQAAALWL